jgi:hypothetical protein
MGGVAATRLTRRCTATSRIAHVAAGAGGEADQNGGGKKKVRSRHRIPVHGSIAERVDATVEPADGER